MAINLDFRSIWKPIILNLEEYATPVSLPQNEYNFQIA